MELRRSLYQSAAVSRSPSPRLDRAGQDAPAHERPVERVQGVLGDLILDDDAQRQGKRRQDLPHEVEILLGEAVFVFGRPGNGDPVMGFGTERRIAEGDDQRQVVGKALAP